MAAGVSPNGLLLIRDSRLPHLRPWSPPTARRPYTAVARPPPG